MKHSEIKYLVYQFSGQNRQFQVRILLSSVSFIWSPYNPPQQEKIRCSVMAITVRSHRADQGSIPCFGVSFCRTDEQWRLASLSLFALFWLCLPASTCHPSMHPTMPICNREESTKNKPSAKKNHRSVLLDHPLLQYSPHRLLLRRGLLLFNSFV